MRMAAGALVCLAYALCAWGADPGARIRAAVDGAPETRAAFWGILIADLDTGKTVYERNADHFFVPASNTKLFTTALGLVRLGPDHRCQTTVLAERAPDAAGTVPGLRLLGGGDPNLSARAIPYRTGPPTGNPLAAIEDLAEQVAARGVRRVDGDIVGDDTAYVWQPFAEGWAVDDPIWEYGAPVSALTVNDNAFSLTVQPGAHAGDLAVLALLPALEFYRIDNRVLTVAGGERRIRIDREPGSRQLRLWGAIPLGDRPDTTLLGIDDPACYAALALRDALARRGVTVAGRARARHLFPNEVDDLARGSAPPAEPGVELARRISAPLLEDLRITDKVSQNLHAEMTLRAVARARRGIGSREAGLEEMKAFLDEAGIPRTAYHFNDGSGLARLNLVTPAAVVGLLRWMWASPARDQWTGLLPVAGQDGTLEKRLAGTAAAGRIRAKTGTLSHVSALSGYAAPRGGGHLAFAILVNNYNGASAPIRAAVDKICSLMVE